jgi:hypothetical protein
MHGLSPLIPQRASRTIAAMTARLLLDERILADGTHARTYASFVDGHVIVEDEDGSHGALSITALERVMTKYGLPLEPDVKLDGESLAVGGDRCLRRLRYHAAVDATGRDYLVWERTGEPPLAVIATHATAALRYLVLRLDGERADT